MGGLSWSAQLNLLSCGVLRDGRSRHLRANGLLCGLCLNGWGVSVRQKSLSLGVRVVDFCLRGRMVDLSSKMQPNVKSNINTLEMYCMNSNVAAVKLYYC